MGQGPEDPEYLVSFGVLHSRGLGLGNQASDWSKIKPIQVITVLTSHRTVRAGIMLPMFLEEETHSQ